MQDRTPLRLAEIVPLRGEEARRALQKPAAKRCFLLHSWTKWEITAGGGRQQRDCINCGKRVYRWL